MTKTIHDNVDKNGAIKHYIEEHGSVPLWVLVNYLTIGNLSHLYDILKDGDKNSIAKYYSHKYKNQYHTSRDLKIQSSGLKSALKIINLVRNKCAHDERLYNSDFGHVGLSGVSDYYGMNKINNKKIVVVIIWLKVLLDKKYFQIFYSELEKIFKKYQEDFKTVKFDSILKIMGINIKEIQKLK